MHCKGVILPMDSTADEYATEFLSDVYKLYTSARHTSSKITDSSVDSAKTRR